MCVKANEIDTRTLEGERDYTMPYINKPKHIMTTIMNRAILTLQQTYD